MVSDGVRWRPIGPFVVLQPMAGVAATVDEVPVQQVLVPGGLLGADGGMRLYALFSFTGSGGARTLRAKFGGATFCFQAAGTANFSVSLSRVLSNVTPTSQIALPNAVYEGVLSGNPIFSSSIDTTQDQILSLSVQLASAGDSATLRKLIVEVL